MPNSHPRPCSARMAQTAGKERSRTGTASCVSPRKKVRWRLRWRHRRDHSARPWLHSLSPSPRPRAPRPTTTQRHSACAYIARSGKTQRTIFFAGRFHETHLRVPPAPTQTDISSLTTRNARQHQFSKKKKKNVTPGRAGGRVTIGEATKPRATSRSSHQQRNNYHNLNSDLTRHLHSARNNVVCAHGHVNETQLQRNTMERTKVSR